MPPEHRLKLSVNYLIGYDQIIPEKSAKMAGCGHFIFSMSGEETSNKRIQPANLLTIVTFNVASLRAAWRKGFAEYVARAQPDILCVQETKMSKTATPGIEELKIDGYHAYFLHAKKPGYSGTAIYTKIAPIAVTKSSGISDENGRCITAEFDKFFLVNTYVVNAGEGLKNLETKISTFLPQLKAHIDELKGKKPVIWTGDLNVAHEDIDIWEPKGHEKIAGFTKEEREWFHEFLAEGWSDVFRTLYPDRQQFSFFNFRGNARAKGHGWRIDYFVVPKEFMEKEGLVYDCSINNQVDFSDHLPVALVLDRDQMLTEADKAVEEAKAEDICEKKGAATIEDFVKPKAKPKGKRK